MNGCGMRHKAGELEDACYDRYQFVLTGLALVFGVPIVHMPRSHRMAGIHIHTRISGCNAACLFPSLMVLLYFDFSEFETLQSMQPEVVRIRFSLEVNFSDLR